MKLFFRGGIFIALLLTLPTTMALASKPASASYSIPWDMKALSKAPAMFPVETQEPGVSAFYYESVPWRGKPTRIFAYYGVPKHNTGQKLPAMVLVHGGSGSAYAEWVRMWNRRGYAAIAMDHFGRVPVVAPADNPYMVKPVRNPNGGPAGDGGYGQVDEPITDQWTYQAVSAVVLANSLLRSFPEVDANRIGVTGISWGGFITSIVAGVDSRFRFAIPVYGCGFLEEAEGSILKVGLDELGPERVKKWSALWDPSVYLPQAKMPMLWINSTNDFAFPLNVWQKSVQLPIGKQTLSLHVRMEHGQDQGATPEEIYAYAAAMLSGGQPLATVKQVVRAKDETVKVDFKSKVRIVKVDLNYTRDSGLWNKRNWESIPAPLIKSGVATAKLPVGATAFFISLTDERGLIVSSEYQLTEAVVSGRAQE